MVPDGFEDPSRPSGGNTYDRRLSQELAADGWSVHTHAVAGAWPCADRTERRTLAELVESIPGESLVLVDGLVASAVPEILVPGSRRLRVVALMHLPLGYEAGRGGAFERERAVLGAMAAVVTTSDWSRRWLLTAYGLEPTRLHVARPGVDTAERAIGTAHGGNLLCVGAVTPGKGHDLLLAALARVADLTWRCRCVGALTVAPEFVDELRGGIRTAGLVDRFVLTGPRTSHQLAASYAAADALILASSVETYGMVVTEALARGLPVLATDVGGVSEALGVTPDGLRPGLVVPPGDIAALAGSLRRWLCDPALRRRLRDTARRRRAGLSRWSDTAAQVGRVLAEVGA